MFKNPLKYQQGGKTQDPIGQLVKWIAQNTGLDENQISQRLNQILNDDTAKQQLVSNLQDMQKGDQNAAQNIIGMFVPQSAKFGGKIRDFICKHAKGGALKGCGCKQEGGNVEKHQDANGKIGVTNGQYQASDWENEFNQFTPTPGGGYARNYRLPMFGGHRWGIPGNTLRQVLITYGDNGIPRKAVRDLEGYYGNGQIDTVIYDAYGNKHNSPEFEARVNRELEGMDPHQRPIKKENGGNVEKAQNGEKTNDTPYNGTISQGKPRSKVSQAIDNNSKARNFVKGAKQFVKSPMIKWPLAGALAYGGYRLGLTPTVQSMGEELAPHMAPYLFSFLSQMRPKFILDTMNPMKEPPKVEKPSDVFWAVPSDEKGGKVEKAQNGNNIGYSKDNIHYYKRKKEDAESYDTEVIDTPDASVVLYNYPSFSASGKRDSTFFVYPSNGKKNVISRKWKQSFVPSVTDAWPEDNRWKRIDVAGPSTFNQMRDWWNYYKSKSKK